MTYSELESDFSFSINSVSDFDSDSASDSDSESDTESYFSLAAMNLDIYFLYSIFAFFQINLKVFLSILITESIVMQAMQV